MMSDTRRLDPMFTVPRVGVALMVRRWEDETILLHKRLSKHAYGTWANAGGHLELYEDFEECALRELEEEAGSSLKVTKPKFWKVLNTKFPDERKHYVLILLVADWLSGEPQTQEPDKCAGWAWFKWDNLPQPLINGMHQLALNNDNPFKV